MAARAGSLGRVQKKSGDLVFGGNERGDRRARNVLRHPDSPGRAKFFATHKVPDAARTLQQTLERIDECSAAADDANLPR